MSYSHIPDGFQTVSPYFCVDNARQFIAFLESAFGAELLYLKKGNDDKTVDHALIKIGTSMIEISDANANFPAREFSCQLFVEDCDKVFTDAIKEGAASLGELSDKPYGVRAGYVKDAWGNQWYISTQIKNRYKPAFWKILEEQY
jgi:PhnB protein